MKKKLLVLTAALMLSFLPAGEAFANTQSKKSPDIPVRLMATGVYRYTTANALNFREGPSLDYDVMDTIPYGTRIRLLRYGTTWSKISYNGVIGYVSTKYLSTVDPD